MHHTPFEQRAPERRAAFGLDWNISDIIHEFGRKAVGLGTVENSVFLAGNDGLIGIAEPGGGFNEGLQHRLQIESRPADDLEHVGGRGLLLQQFTQLVEQPRILDGDDGLVGEVLHQFDLLVGEWPYILAIDCDGANRFAFLQHGHRDVRTRSSQLNAYNAHWIAFSVGLVGPEHR